jgi:hypothetical protein
MKTLQSFKASRFYFAMVAAVALGLLLATKITSAFNLHVNPVTVAFVSAGLVAVVFSMLFENRNWE